MIKKSALSKSHSNGKGTPPHHRLGAWITDHHLFLLAVAAAVSVVLVMMVANANRPSPKFKRRFLLIGRYVTNALAAFLGVLFMPKVAPSVADFPVAKPLTVAVSIIVCMYAFNFLWTLIVMKPRDGLLVKGSAYSLLNEEEGLEEISEVDTVFAEATAFLMVQATRDAFLKSYINNSPDAFLSESVDTIIGKLRTFNTSDVQMQGTLLTEADGRGLKFGTSIPTEFHGIMTRALKHRDEPHLVEGSSPSMKNGVAVAIEWHGSTVVTLLWSNKKMDPAAILLFWSLFLVFLADIESIEVHQQSTGEKANSTQHNS